MPTNFRFLASSLQPSTMRIIAIILVVYGLQVLPYSAFAQSTSSQPPHIISATVCVDGLTCSLCHKSVYKALKKLNFVESLSPNLDETSLDITFVRNAEVSFDRIAEAVQDAGFSIGILRANVDFPPMLVRKDEHIALGGALLHLINVAEERTIQGRVNIKLIDAKFIPDDEAAKWRTDIHHSCYKTGSVEECCDQSESRTKSTTRVYHGTL